MSLNWNITDVKNWKAITEDGQWPITDALIWATMAIGLGEITETNYPEFYRRLSAFETQNGAYLISNGKPSPITLKDVKRRIGLRTNVSKLTNKQFDSNLIKKKQTNSLT